MTQLHKTPLVAVVPAAGVGKRMQSHQPKQYLTINGKTVLEHTVERLLSHSLIKEVIVVLGADDDYFASLSLASNPNVTPVVGGKERVDSVLAGLEAVNQTKFSWVLVHDAARPCVTLNDIDALVTHCFTKQSGGLLGYTVRDTMKRSDEASHVTETVEREQLWHALTPQMYQVKELISAIEHGLKDNVNITDESSAIEAAGFVSTLVLGQSDNIKITRPDDLVFAEFILKNQLEQK